MRNSLIDALFPKTRQEILAALLVSPDHRFTLSDLSRHIGVPPSSLQRELTSLTGAEILQKEEDGRRVYYKANANHPLFSDLQSIFVKTIGLADVVKVAIEPLLDGIAVTFIYGSIARQERTPKSDIDLMIIGSVGLSDLALPRRIAEEKLQSPINAIHYSATEFRNKVLEGNHFLLTVLPERKIFL